MGEVPHVSQLSRTPLLESWSVSVFSVLYQRVVDSTRDFFFPLELHQSNTRAETGLFAQVARHLVGPLSERLHKLFRQSIGENQYK